MKAIFLSATLLLGLTLALYSMRATAQPNPPSTPTSLTIIPDFQETVEPYISETDPGLGIPEWYYHNRLFANLYENDTLVLSTKDSAEMSDLFRSSYYWQNDTLFIEGIYGLFGGYGFMLKVHKDKARTYFRISTDTNWYAYAYTEKSALLPRLEVPCREATVILDALPDSSNPTIYGYVKFRSGEYYINKSIENLTEERITNDEVDDRYYQRTKARADMKVYFRSDAKAE